MSRPRVVLVRGHHANVVELRPWEELADRFDLTCLVTGSTESDLTSLRLPTVRVRARRDVLPRSRLADVAVTVPGDAYLGLERHLAGADIVHSAELGPWFSRQPALLKRQLGFKLVLTVWETIPLLGAYRTFRARAYRAEMIPHVDVFVATTERARESLLLEGVRADRIEVSPPGIERRRFAAARSARGGADGHVIVSAGRLVWEKGHQDVLRALAALERGLVPLPNGEAARVRLLVVGAGPERSRLERYAAELGLAERVDFRRVPYERMPEVFAEASCLVLASLPVRLWEEQFGLVLAEAMAGGVPIVASESGAIPEVVGESASLFRPGDWMGLARALAEGPLARPPGERVEHRPELLERYSTTAAAARIGAIYERLLSSR